MPRHKPIKAFKNARFMDSRDARVLRLMAEYIEPQKRLREAGVEDTIVFFGSARIPSRETAEAKIRALRQAGSASAEQISRVERGLKMSEYYEAARSLAFRLAKWSEELARSKGDPGHRFSIVTGGGPGIMEAANRGAAEAGGRTLGMNISLPFEQYPNEHIADGLAFEFHYFFMRKFWLVYLAKAAVVMPGGFGTLDEFTELLTLVQTGKIRRKLPILLYGSDYWNRVLSFAPMAEFETIDARDLGLFHISDSVDDAFEWLRQQLLEWAVDNPGAGLTDTVEQIGRF